MSTIKNQFDLHTRLFNNVLDGIDNATTDARANDHVNHLKWIAGHLTSARFGFKDLAGLEQQDPHAEYFSRGKDINPDVEYPPIAEIKDNWNAISGQISAALGKLPEEALAANAPKVPIGDGKMGEFLDFLMHHEAYHIGQMGILRKFAGLNAMSYA